MGIETDDHRLDEQGTPTLAQVLHERLQGVVHLAETGAVDAHRFHAESGRHLVDLRVRLLLLRHADGVAVVLDHEQDRQPVVLRLVDRLEEFPFGRRSLATRDVHDLVLLVRLDRHSHPDGDQELRAGAGGRRDDAQGAGGEVLRHVPAERVGVPLARQHPLEDLVERHPQPDHQRLLTIIGEEPVPSGLQQHGDRDLHLLVPARRGVERALAGAHEDAALLLDEVGPEHFLVELEEQVGVHAGRRGLRARALRGQFPHGHCVPPKPGIDPILHLHTMERQPG